MAINTFTSGVNTSFSTELNSNFSGTFAASILNNIQILGLATSDFSISSDFNDVFSEYYSDINGVRGSVSAISGHIGFDPIENIYFVGDFDAAEVDGPVTGYYDTSQNAIAYSTLSNVSSVAKRINTIRFIEDSGTAQTGVWEIKEGGASSGTTLCQGTVPITTAADQLIEIDVSSYGVCILPSNKLTLKITLPSGGIISDALFGGASEVNGCTLILTSVGTLDSLSYSTSDFSPWSYIDDAEGSNNTGTITHTIPSGTFSPTTSSLVGKCLFRDWESGVSASIKITGSGEDSGYVTDGSPQSFTAFASEPTALVVQLTSKSSGATARTPSIKGVGVITR